MPGMTRPDLFFEKRYIACRTLEKRMYSDEEVIKLPECPATHPHYREWRMRRASAGKLCAYLATKKKPLAILEIGCGNGWMLHQLSTISRTSLTGLDINFTELQQAARIFSGCHKMRFIYGDIYSGILKDKQFDIILLAASIQYFKSLDEILELCLQHLSPGGEIHVIDTKFYHPKETAAAKQRSRDHFQSLGFPEMSRYYFHHAPHT
jgi:ubiquinone/menaquinone biosynthesis C-methylase UbiE